MKQIKFVDTHTHTKHWNKEHFAEIDPSAFILSLDTHLQIPSKITCLKRKENIIFGYGLQHYTKFDVRLFHNYLDSLTKEVSDGRVMLLGELGLDYGASYEERMLYEQLIIAKDYHIPVIIHTPRKNKRKIYERIKKIVEMTKIDHSLCLIDHADKNIISKNEPCFYFGITVQPDYGKLSFEQAKQLVLENSDISNRLVANSDYSNLECRKQSLKEVNNVRFLQEIIVQVDPGLSRKVTLENALNFIGVKE